MAEEPQPYDLIHVAWGEGQGLVSLEQGRWLFYTWGRLSGHHARDDIPTVGVTDQDFVEILGDDPDHPERANWDHVVDLLRHDDFPLEERIKEQEWTPSRSRRSSRAASSTPLASRTPTTS